MIIIKHKKERPHNYYRADCNCGCVFTFDEVEFRNYKTIGTVPNIDCPECGANYVKGSSNIKPISKEEYQRVAMLKASVLQGIKDSENFEYEEYKNRRIDDVAEFLFGK